VADALVNGRKIILEYILTLIEIKWKTEGKL
jgi:hypothetical protein